MGDPLVAFHLANKATELRFSGHVYLEPPSFTQGPEHTNVSWKQIVDG